MSDSAISTVGSAQSELWLQGLLTVAWADGDYTDEEKALVSDLLGNNEVDNFQPLKPQQLVDIFTPDDPKTDDFLRTAVMVAIADGTYSESEDQLLQEFCQALGRTNEILSGLKATLVKQEGEQCVPTGEERHDLLDPMRQWLDQMQIHDPKIAHFLCRMIPAQCPFEQDVVLFGRKIVHIPPMCKLNPLYEQLVGLRFRALSYLADQSEDAPN
ncbi:Tellurite resistance protein [Gloeomargarita lithophora Alchichica-D10]|uniref:Tellurite resistance protein n=1 Tax=Gloeomargarita lithophora Alchichica-D10 TaxID=1188229 RepID=A0A1J0AD50_9CYAN|nr:Mo-dependent nitrogenase C-terminal domain-containing protein [Gloeomargarita lithophora]APB33843.1 Tellurite resistance protein [Gloeomargarita lithophora Alchichica-D10]